MHSKPKTMQSLAVASILNLFIYYVTRKKSKDNKYRNNLAKQRIVSLKKCPRMMVIAASFFSFFPF